MAQSDVHQGDWNARARRGKGVKAAIRDRKIAQWLVGGETIEQIGEKLGEKDVAVVRRWVRRPEVQRRVDQILGGMEHRIADTLATGERLAADVMVEFTADEGLDPELRAKCAMRLLDMAGQRGKPVDRQVVKNLTYNPADIEKALLSALADPGVRKAFPDVFAGMKELPAGAAEEVVLGSPCGTGGEGEEAAEDGEAVEYVDEEADVSVLDDGGEAADVVA